MKLNNYPAMISCRLCMLILFCACLTASAQQTSGFKLIFEKAYLHTDRENYTGGEDIWFKAYLVNGQTNQLFASSNNLYAELISPDNKIADRKIIRLENGLGKGDFKLRDSIAPGTYRIRAYTNWMRNYGDNFIFEKAVQVYGAAGKPQAGIITTSRYKSVNKLAETPIVVQTNVHKSIRFFPEGGSMIENITGRVAYKADDGYGRELGIQAEITSSAGEHIILINSKTGVGAFMLKPTPGKTYIAKGTYSTGETFTVDLPQALLSGLSMAVSATDSLVQVTVKTNKAAFNSKTAMLAINNKGKMYFMQEVKIDDTLAVVNIPVVKLPAGINEITLLDSDKKPHAQRLIYIDERMPVSLNIHIDKQVYNAREKVALHIKAVTKTGVPAKANLSVTVTDASIVKASETDITSYLNLQSELRGRINNPARYFDPENPNRKNQLDLLLLTQGWRDFVWRRVADSAIRISYNIEQGMTVSGRVRQLWINKPVTGVNINLWTFKQAGNDLKMSNSIYYSKTDTAGRFFMDKIDIYGRQLLKLYSISNSGKKAGILEEDSIAAPPHPIRAFITKPFADSILTLSGDSVAYKFMALKRGQRLRDTIQLKEVVVKSAKMQEISNTVTIIDDKFRKAYHTVIAYLAGECEYCIPDISRLGMNIGKEALRVIVNGYLKYGPRSSDDYYTLSMDKVESIGLLIFADTKGLAGMATITVRPDAFVNDFNVKYFYVNGYYEARDFYSPVYELPSRRPDLRTTIHWEPNITTNANGEATITYYNADPKTSVRIVAEGITDKGIPVQSSIIYEVK